MYMNQCICYRISILFSLTYLLLYFNYQVCSHAYWAIHISDLLIDELTDSNIDIYISFQISVLLSFVLFWGKCSKRIITNANEPAPPRWRTVRRRLLLVSLQARLPSVMIRFFRFKKIPQLLQGIGQTGMIQ